MRGDVTGADTLYRHALAALGTTLNNLGNVAGAMGRRDSAAPATAPHST